MPLCEDTIVAQPRLGRVAAAPIVIQCRRRSAGKLTQIKYRAGLGA